MTIELPKDAEGREIPPDTAKSFDAGGAAYDTTRRAYMTDFHTDGSRAGQWRVATDTCGKFDPEPMYPTPPDSRGQPGEDPTAPNGGQAYGPCRHFHESGDDRMPCPARDAACGYRRAGRAGGDKAGMGVRCPGRGGRADPRAGHIGNGHVPACEKGRPPMRGAGYHRRHCDPTAIPPEKCEPKEVDHGRV